jgi:predicted nucleic-acid-binding protein
MIALDTNVLVRFLVDDDEVQSRRAAALIRRAIDKDEPLHVSNITLCELVWVLEASYGFARDEIAKTLDALLQARHLSFIAPDGLARALTAYARGRGDLADYVIREEARAAGCDTVVTFDRALCSEPGFSKP